MYKKFILLIISCFMTGLAAMAQLTATPTCPAFEVDVLAGTVNDLYAKSAIGEIQEEFPCFTGFVLKDSASVCAGVFYKDKDIKFYTDRRYIEIGEKFKGKITGIRLGTSRSSLFNVLGHPKIKDIGWDAFQMGYGTLVLYYNKAAKINKILISSKSTDTLKLCEPD